MTRPELRAREKESQPLLLTQSAVAEALKRATRLRAVRRGDATSVAASLETPEA